MPAGIQIINTSGTILIDDTNPSLAMSHKIGVNTPANTSAFIDITGVETPNVFWRQASDGWAIVGGGFSVISGGRRYSISASKPALGANNPINATAYVFDRPKDSGVNSGLKIYDSAGRLTFDAMGKYGRVAAVIDGNGSWTGSAGRAYACCVLGRRKIEEQVNGSVAGTKRVNAYETGFRWSGNTCFLEDALISDVQFPSATTNYYRVYGSTPKLLIIDVTGY